MPNLLKEPKLKTVIKEASPRAEPSEDKVIQGAIKPNLNFLNEKY